MKRVLPTVFVLMIGLCNSFLKAQGVSDGLLIHVLPNKCKEHVHVTEDKDDKNSTIISLSCHNNITIQHDHVNTSTIISMSLEEIISSDDSIDFNCVGGFCMKKSHTHKKGLSTRRQFFDYFMRIST